jgi:hypothetical protein
MVENIQWVDITRWLQPARLHTSVESLHTRQLDRL